MKDRKLRVRVTGIPRDFYLFKPKGERAWCVKFFPPEAVRQRLGKGRLFHSTGTTEIEPAREIAARFIERHWCADKLEANGVLETKPDRLATMGELLKRYGERATQRPGTVRSNARSLKYMVRVVTGTQDPLSASTSILTKEFIRKFEEARLAAAGRDAVSQQRVRFSTGSYVRQARSVVALRKMKFYEGLQLPDLKDFRIETVELPKRTRPRPLDMNALTAMEAAVPTLATTDPGTYVAHLMFSRWALRNIEIENARVHWIVGDKLGIIDRPEEDFYPKGCEGWIPIARDVLEEILRFQYLCVDGYLVPGKDKTERHNAIYRRHSKWVGTWIKDHRKTSYELRRYAGSRLLDMGATLMQVRDFLRHQSQATTEAWYCYRLQNRDLPVIGMRDLAPEVNAA